MLQLQTLVLLLHLPQAPQFDHRCGIDRRHLAHQFAIPHLLSPSGVHERMNAQRIGDISD